MKNLIEPVEMRMFFCGIFLNSYLLNCFCELNSAINFLLQAKKTPDRFPVRCFLKSISFKTLQLLHIPLHEFAQFLAFQQIL